MAGVTTIESEATTTGAADSPRSNPPRNWRRTFIRAVVLLVALAALGAGSCYAWQYFSTYESTDDAEVDGHINAISVQGSAAMFWTCRWRTSAM